MIMPLGTYMTPNRLIGLAAVFCSADNAGIMLSSSGSASIEPMPRRTVRRGMAFFEMIMVNPSWNFPINQHKGHNGHKGKGLHTVGHNSSSVSLVSFVFDGASNMRSPHAVISDPPSSS